MKERRERATLCHARAGSFLIEIKVCRRGPVIDFFVHERTLLQIDRQLEAAGHLRVGAVKPGRVLVGPNSARVFASVRPSLDSD